MEYPKAVYHPNDNTKYQIAGSAAHEQQIYEDWGVEAPKIELKSRAEQPADDSADSVNALRAELEQLRAEKAEREAKSATLAKARDAKKAKSATGTKEEDSE